MIQTMVFNKPRRGQSQRPLSKACIMTNLKKVGEADEERLQCHYVTESKMDDLFVTLSISVTRITQSTVDSRFISDMECVVV